MGSPMRSFLVLALLLAAAPAWAGDELIRFRQADGTLGLVDDDDKLPRGAVVLERTPLRRPSEAAPAPFTTTSKLWPVAAGNVTSAKGLIATGNPDGSNTNSRSLF